MRNRPTEEHREAVTRRLELLRAELSLPAAAPEPPDDPPTLAMAPVEVDPWWPDLPVTELAPAVDRSAAGEVPVPGRHASRRSWLAEWLPATLRGRMVVGPWQLAVVAMVVAAGLAVTCWLVVRSDASVVAAGPVAVPASGDPSTAPLVSLSASPAADDPSGTVTIDVAGKVRRPGVLVLPAGSRVVDALAAAGGAKGGVDLGSLNQARVLVDGEQIVVGATAPPVVTAAASGVPAPGALVNLNTAGADELDTLPEVGPVTAQAILDYRTEHGGFASVDELLDVDGIGEATLAKISPHVTV